MQSDTSAFFVLFRRFGQLLAEDEVRFTQSEHVEQEDIDLMVSDAHLVVVEESI